MQILIKVCENCSHALVTIYFKFEIYC